MANWSNPTLTSLYTDFLSELKARDEDLAKQFDGQTVSNLITGTIRWSSSANRWQKWTGSAWGELTTTYALTGLSTTGNATIGGTLGVTGAATLSGGGTSTTPATADNSTAIATTAYVKAQAYATLASPALSGTPTAPTAALNTNTTQIATTAFVISQGADVAPPMNGTAAVGTSLEFARGDHVHPTDTSRAPLASPTFTGTPAAPTAALGTNTTQLATCAYVNAEIAADAPAKDGTGATGTWAISVTGNAGTATTLATARTINGVSFNGSANITVTANTPQALTAGSFLTSTGTFDGSTARTFAVDATSANTASKVVARDASGNFSAGTITANLTGTASGNLALTGGTLSGALLAAAGTVSAPGIAGSGDTNTGLFWETADRLVMVAGGTRAAYFNTTEQLNYGNIYITTADDAAADAVTTTITSGGHYLRGKYWNGTTSVNVDWNSISAPTDTSGNSEWRLRTGSTNRLTVSNAGTVTATTFSGSGASLTSLNASNLSSGTVPDARLSGTYTSASIGGNAATATTLATARTINGTSFNGSANITTSTWGTARTITLGLTGKSVDGSANVSWSLAEIGALPLAGGTLTGPLLAATGSLAAPGIAASGDTNTGLWWESADRLVVVAGGARAAYFDAANQFNYGNIFITTADDAAADATTTTRTSGASYLRGKYWNGTASVNTDWNTIYVPTDTAGNGEWRLRNGGTNRLVVNNSGTVTATLFSGSGASLTSLNASNLSSGTLPDARLSGTYTGVSIDGNAGTATTLQTARTINGVSFNGSANISVNTVNSLTFNNGGAGGASGSTFNGGGALTVSYNTVGAPSTTGTNASGTWGISITGSSASCTGNSATVTNGVYTTGNQSIGGVKNFTDTLEAYDSSADGTIVTATKFGRDSTQYVTFYGNASGNRLLAVSDLAAPKDFQIRVTDTSLTGAFTFARSGTLTATAFSGNGASLTSLNASNLGSGTVPSARLSGSYGIDITGNAATANTLSSNRTFQLTGDVTGSVLSDLNTGASIATTVVDNSHNHNTSTLTDVDGSNYTPTLTNTTNITSSSVGASDFFYTRVGSTVTVAGKVTVTVTTANSLFVLTMTIPVAKSSNFGNSTGAAGVAADDTASIYGRVQSVGSTQTVNLRGRSTVAGSAREVGITFSYVL